MKWSKKALLAKIESAYGTDPTPAASADEVLIGIDVELNPISAEGVKREVVRAGGEFGSYPELIVGKHMMLEFSVEMAGAGAVDSAPVYGPLLRACRRAETITPTTGPVEYEPVSDSFESVTIYMAIDGTRYKLVGCRGSVRAELTVNQRPMLRFSMLALYTAPTDATYPTMDYSGAQKALAVSDDNTPTFTLHGEDIKVASCSIDFGGVVNYRELVNQKEIVISDGEPSGQVTFEAVTVATKDWYGAVTGETLDALQIVHGTANGNICQFDAPKVQLKNPRLSGSQDRKMLQLDMIFTPDSGDDELKYTTK